MNIISLNESKFNTNTQTYRLLNPSFFYANGVSLDSIVVERDREMRPDLIMKDMYGYDNLENLDIILYINGIDNPLNIPVGTILYYPSSGDLDRFRFAEIYDNYSSDKTTIKKSLSTPNKTTREDKKRGDYLANGYSLPPTVLDTPRPPVRLENGNILVGGL